MVIGPRPSDVVVALDNDVLNLWRTRTPAIVKAINNYFELVKAAPAIPSTTIFEVMRGFENAVVQSGVENERLIQDKERVRNLINQCRVLPFNQDAAEIAAYIYPRLKGRNKLWKDMLIAATALAHDYGVATRNRRDFELIAQHTPPHHPPLRIEIWK